ncbi:hypothetical protein H0H87_000259 [Tephrocybe sp. NHM501043]|nr:hypothetical protein H0H87_000259 [Tephrocybe sp. NHM501043]
MLASAPDTQPSTNLTFYIDNSIYGTFFHQYPQPPRPYPHYQEEEAPQTHSLNVFSKTGLPHTMHALKVSLAQDSVFAFDYLVYTREGRATRAKSDSAILLQERADENETSQQTQEQKKKKHNIATFGGAIGGSVGVLALVALGLAFSIIKRRRNYERRERALMSEASDDSPRMIGPRPFVPRFFPGTEPANNDTSTPNPDGPPPYIESFSGSGSGSDTSHSHSHSHSTSHETPAPPSPPQMRSIRTLSEFENPPPVTVSYIVHLPLSGPGSSYADIPPSTPPPPPLDRDEDLRGDSVIMPPPPPFGVAIASEGVEHGRGRATGRADGVDGELSGNRQESNMRV